MYLLYLTCLFVSFFKEKMLLYRLEEQNFGQVSRIIFLLLLVSGGKKLDASVFLMKFMSSCKASVM